jgi:hypothetical protein
LLSLVSTPVILFWGRGKAGIIAISFMQYVVGFCSCSLYFETDFNTNSLLLYRLHAKHYKTTTHSITKQVIKTKRNVWSTCNKMVCITNGQVVRSLKQHLMWPMHWWFIGKLLELSEHITYTYLLTYLRNWALPEKLPIVQPLRNFPAF